MPKNKPKITLPELEPLRVDAIRVQGVVLEKITHLVTMAKSLEGNPFLKQYASLLEGKWLLKDDDLSHFIEPCHIFDDTLLCIETLEHNLLVAKRYRNKDILRQVVNYCQKLEEEIRLNASETFLNDYGVNLLALYLHIFQIYAKPSFYEFASWLIGRIWNFTNFLQDSSILQSINTQTPENFSGLDEAYYHKMRKLSHGEMVAKGIQYTSLVHYATGLLKDVHIAVRATKLLEKYHGTVHGAFSACDYLDGKSPNAGVNIVAATEYFMALQQLLLITQDISIANRMETIAINLLCAYIAKDKIQAMQSTNQIDLETPNPDWKYAEEKTLSYFPPEKKERELLALCKCLNAFVQSMWLKNRANGLILMFPFSSKIKILVNEKPVTIVLKSQYPHDENIEITIHTAEPVHFPIYIRIPEFATQASVCVNKDVWQSAMANHFFIVSKTYKNGDKIKIKLPLNVQFNRHYRRSCAVFKGPVLYALPQDKEQKYFSNIALNTKTSVVKEQVENGVLQLKGYTYEGQFDKTTLLPLMPECSTEAVDIKLIPYNRTVERIAQFPTLDVNED